MSEVHDIELNERPEQDACDRELLVMLRPEAVQKVNDRIDDVVIRGCSCTPGFRTSIHASWCSAR